MKETIAILILCSPLVWELWNDRNGDTNKRSDVYFRFILAMGSAFLSILLTNRNQLLAFNLSVAIHWLCFDYFINMVLYRNGVIVSPKWFYVLGKKGDWDNLVIWKSIGPYGRLFVKLGYFLLAAWLYLKF